MRVKKNRATLKNCKDCCFKEGIRCTYPCAEVDRYKQGGKLIEADCSGYISVNWDKDSHPIDFKHRQKNWQRMHRKEHIENIRRKTRNDILWRKYWKERGL